jgi:hypothetical protein
VISDFAGDDWSSPMSMLAMRHDLLAIGIADPPNFDVPQSVSYSPTRPGRRE